MSAELLRRAAKTLREHAEAASAGRWEAHPDGLVWAERIGDPVSGSTEVEDANYVALMHPPVALALADLLDAHIPLFAGLRIPAPDDHEVFRLARAILRQEES